MSKKIVEKGYDKIADWYYRDRLKTKGTSILLKKIIKKLPKNGRVLDVGCGVGYPVAKFFSDKGYSVVGIDLSENMLKIARDKVPKAKFYKKDMTKMNFQNNYFDVIISILALLHVPKEKHESVLEKMYKMLKPGGFLLISMTKKDDGNYVNNWMGKTNMYWSTSSKKENLLLLEKIGFRPLWIKELGLSDDKHVYVLAKK